MRLTQLVIEGDYNDELRAEAITLLTAVSAEGMGEINTMNLVADLNAQGYSVNASSLVELLNSLDIVQTADANTIKIATIDPEDEVDAGTDPKRVDRLATKNATDSIGSTLGEDAEMLNVGDPVIITGDVNHHGETGDIVSFGKDKMFVVVDLYNFGKTSFQSSDVEFNDYADSEEEEHDMRRAMGDDDYDRMHGDLGYNDDDDDSYYEGKTMSDTNRLRELAGLKNKPLNEAMSKPQPGQAYGATDTGAPEEHSEEQLSRAADLLYYADQLGVQKEVWAALPRNLKVEWNYSKWRYVPDRG
jgi:hypothetical protein